MKNFEKALVLGGAGFIGSATVDLLINKRYQVTVFDNLEPQVHGKARQKPQYLNSQADFVFGEVTFGEVTNRAALLSVRTRISSLIRCSLDQ